MEPNAQAAPAQEPKPAAPAPDAPAPDPAASPAEAQPERQFSQKELDEIIKKKDAKRLRERDDLRRENEVLRKLALERASQQAPQQEPQQPKAQGEPTREQFGTYEEFIEKRAEWRADQRVDQKFKDRDAQDRTARAQHEQETQREQFRKAMKDSAKDIEDFDDVVAGIKASDPVANVSASAIDAAEAPGKVLYHLATHPDEAERIAGLSPGKQAREIVRLEEKLSKPPVKPSKAPDPIKPLGGGNAAVGDEMPDAAKNPEKWMEWRKKQLAARKRTGAAA